MPYFALGGPSTPKSPQIGEQLRGNVDQWNKKQYENILERIKPDLIEASQQGKRFYRIKISLTPGECIFLADRWRQFDGFLKGDKIEVLSQPYVPDDNCKCCEISDPGSCVTELYLKW